MTLAIVTGAPGWLGSRLVRSLVLGHPDVPALASSGRSVRCLVQPQADVTELSALGPSVQIVRGDLTDAESLEELLRGAAGATLFHSAGVIHPRAGTQQFHAANVAGTLNLLSASKAARIGRFVHVSSNSPIGTNRDAHQTFTEDSPYEPYMAYGKSKMLAEMAVKRAHQQRDLETVIIRPPWFYGPGQPARQTLFFEMIRDGKVPIVGSGDNRRSMAYVDNICQGLLLCEKVDRAAGQVYWIADATSYSMNEIVETIERVMESSFGIRCAHRRLRLPNFVGNVAQVVDALLQRLGIYHQKIHVLGELNKTIACSIARAQAELGYAPTVSLEEGMRRSIEDMKQRGLEL